MAEHAQIDVAHVARLARLTLTEEEARLFQAQLARVLEYANKLQELDTTEVEAAAHALPVFNVFREDVPAPVLTVEEALKNAPHQANRLFIVTKVVE